MNDRPAARAARGCLAFAILMIWSATSWADSVEVLPGDVPLKIHGKIGDDSTFVKRLGLMSSVAIPELIFRATDLVRSDGKAHVGRQNVVLTSQAKLDLARSTPKDVEIKVTGFKLPGSYKGELYFVQPEKGLTAALALLIEVTADDAPKLMPRKGSETVKIQVIDCAWLGCDIARWFHPAAFLSSYPLAFDNTSLERFDLMVAVNGSGDTTHGSPEPC